MPHSNSSSTPTQQHPPPLVPSSSSSSIPQASTPTGGGTANINHFTHPNAHPHGHGHSVSHSTGHGHSHGHGMYGEEMDVSGGGGGMNGSGSGSGAGAGGSTGSAKTGQNQSQSQGANGSAGTGTAGGSGGTGGKAPAPKERRFKLSRACDRCRRRRIKCDEGHPCQSCLAANSACTFEEPGKRSHPHKSKRASTLEDRMHHLESLIQGIPFTLFNNNGGTPTPTPASGTSASASASGISASGSTPVPSQAPTAPSIGLSIPHGHGGQQGHGHGQGQGQGGNDSVPLSPHASLASATHTYPLGVPPPSLSTFPLVNPGTRFPSSGAGVSFGAGAIGGGAGQGQGGGNGMQGVGVGVGGMDVAGSNGSALGHGGGVTITPMGTLNASSLHPLHPLHSFHGMPVSAIPPALLFGFGFNAAATANGGGVGGSGGATVQGLDMDSYIAYVNAHLNGQLPPEILLNPSLLLPVSSGNNSNAGNASNPNAFNPLLYTHFINNLLGDDAATAAATKLMLNLNLSPNGAVMSPSYLYFDDEGNTRWQGETSGLPLLGLLAERELKPSHGSFHGNTAAGAAGEGQKHPEDMHAHLQHQRSQEWIKKEDMDMSSSSSHIPLAGPSGSGSASSSARESSRTRERERERGEREDSSDPVIVGSSSGAGMGSGEMSGMGGISGAAAAAEENWFPDRQPRLVKTNPETLWRLITTLIVPDLMDSLVQCFLSTTYYLMPFLHVPTFLADYQTPEKWGEPGFASFIVAICCLSSRHIDDPRVRADPNDGFSAGTQWFDLFARLRTLPTADTPTLYTVQSVFVAAVYAVGLGKLSKALALLAEAITLSVDAGLHRSSEAYDIFDPIEEEVRKRTFWCVYMWDKQASAAFGRPPMVRLRDCDVPEPAVVDDEYITREQLGPQPPGMESRIQAFVETVRIFVVLESVLDFPAGYAVRTSPFLARASSVLGAGGRRVTKTFALREEEMLLDELVRSLPSYWAHTSDTMASDNVIRVTQAERLHCLEQFVRMLIQRRRFSTMLAERTFRGNANTAAAANAASPGANGQEGQDAQRTSPGPPGSVGGQGVEQCDQEREAMMKCHECALQLVLSHTQVAAKGLMTYYGVHVIHQLSQAGRSLIAVLLNCKTEDLQPLIPRSLEALRSCVALLRRFSGRYICGLRQGELIEEFCRLTRIPLDAPLRQEPLHFRPPWIRPIRKKTPSTGPRSNAGSNESPQGSPAGSSPAATADPLFDVPQSPDQNSGPFSPTGLIGGHVSTFAMEGVSVTSGGLDGGMGAYSLDGMGLDMLNSGAGGLGGDMGPGGPDTPSLSSSAFMTMLNDGNFDMTSFLQSDVAPSYMMHGGLPPEQLTRATSYDGRSEQPMMGIVSSP